MTLDDWDTLLRERAGRLSPELARQFCQDEEIRGLTADEIGETHPRILAFIHQMRAAFKRRFLAN
jgi:hypothetical protein